MWESAVFSVVNLSNLNMFEVWTVVRPIQTVWRGLLRLEAVTIHFHLMWVHWRWMCCTSSQVQSMAKSNASGVLVYALPGNPLQDMNCVEDECNTALSIPASMVHLEPWVAQGLEYVPACSLWCLTSSHKDYLNTFKAEVMICQSLFASSLVTLLTWSGHSLKQCFRNRTSPENVSFHISVQVIRI